MTKALLRIFFALSLATPAFAANPSDTAFNAAVNDINEAVAKLVAAQAKRSRQVHAEAKSGKDAVCTPAQIDTAYAQVPVCEAALKQAFGVSVRSFNGELNKGFSRDGFSLVLLTTIYDPSDRTGRIPGVLEDVGVLPLPVLEGLNAHIVRVSEGVPGTAVADVYRHFIGHGASAEPDDRWYWRRSLVEPNAVGAHEIRRVWREALDVADADDHA